MPTEPDDLDALLASLEAPEPAPKARVDDLDALLASLNEPAAPAEAPVDDLDALLASLDTPAADEPPQEEAYGDEAPEEAAAEEEAYEEEAPEEDPPAPAVAMPTRAPTIAPAPHATTPPAVAYAAAAPLPPPPRAAAPASRVPPTPVPRPDDLTEAEIASWDALDALILASWKLTDVDRGNLWFTVVGRQGPPVILVAPHDTPPNRTLARPEGLLGQRVASQSGQVIWVRFVDQKTVKLALQSGLGSPDAKKKVTAELERLGYFAGYNIRF